jgi:hypothetical protein
MQASAPKKMRTVGKYFLDIAGTYLENLVGPSYGRPMPLELDHEKENINPNGNPQGNTINKGKQVVQHSEGKSD